ncbi:MAG: VOC family protein [Spirochaetota bacterium]|nr:MAG: VOC family protein [Spirochaetota bacterium]
MTEDSIVKVKAINQIAIAVKDLEMVAENYWKILGIGPWEIYDWEEPLVYDREYYGKPAWAREKIAVTRVGSVEFELVQPVDGPSVYGDWIEKHGEGLHHMNFLVDSSDEFEKIGEALVREGFPSLQRGRYGPSKLKYGFHYIDIPPLRTIWEPVYEGEDFGVKPTIVPDTKAKSPAKIQVKDINQLAIAVKDVEKVAANYEKILGIGPWTFFDWEPPLVYDRKYYGKPAWGRDRIALAQVGDVQLELMQGVEGPSIYKDWIEEHGEGLHHVNWLVDDVDETEKILAKEGFSSIQGGKYGPRDQKGAYSYIDIQPLRTIWEPVCEIEDVHGHVVKE